MKGPTTRERDYAYEALAEVTSTDMSAGRGELNAALKSIREQSEIEDSYLLADEIHERAKAYRQVMGEVLLTPSALSKHWQRVKGEATKVRGQNLSAERSSSLPLSRREENMKALEELKKTLWGAKT